MDRDPVSSPTSSGYPASYYAATANPAPGRPPVDGTVHADICIVGAGYTGLSTALHLAEKGHRVTVVEGEHVGWGASGRNGGQVVNGLNASLESMERQFGAEAAARIGPMMQDGAKIIRRLIDRHAIDCDLKPRNLFAAFTQKHLAGFEAKARLWERHGVGGFELLDREGMRAHVGTDAYCGGMIDHAGGHLHPLNLALGEAAALESLGGVIHETSPVLSIDQSGPSPVVHTQTGRVEARTLILCGNAYLGDAVPALAARVMPVSTQIVATERLGGLAETLLPTDICVEDARYILDYYRLAADGRLLFGGGVVYGGTDPKDIVRKLRPNMERIFPELKDRRIEFAWSGNFALSFTRMPQIGRLGDNVYFAHGYSGHGITGSHLFGQILAEAIDGDLGRFDLFSRLPWVPFPGGRTFRAQYSTIGSWWYAMRDALGV